MLKYYEHFLISSNYNENFNFKKLMCNERIKTEDENNMFELMKYTWRNSVELRSVAVH